MNSNLQFIPAGRTSSVKRGNTLLQVQTEYAHRPNPRITTTILDNGRVLHKVERGLENAISSLEEQRKVESTLIRQHAEVLAIIQKDSPDPSASKQAGEEAVEVEPPVLDRIKAVPGVQSVIEMENDGAFTSPELTIELQKQFGFIFKNLRELMELFERVPGGGMNRRQGVYEIERDRLYFMSSGSECYFVVVRRVNVTTQYEQELKAIVHTDPW
jgi:hypothetical protein